MTCKQILRLGAAMAIILTGSWFIQTRVHAADEQPKVTLDAAHIGPRDIEDLTRKSVARDYGYAWSTMTEALRQNRPDLLNAYFTGFAKQDLTNKLNDQKRTGVRVVYHDLGHHLDALFYSPAGDAMQLRDTAQLQIEVMEGGKVLSRNRADLQYMVLMTPGADRWMVRDLEGVPASKR